MEIPPTPAENPPERSVGARNVTYRTREQNLPGTPNKDERLLCFEPVGFIYDDTDSFFHEIAEWFCYDESEDLKQMKAKYEAKFGSGKKWSLDEKKQHIRGLIEQLDISNDQKRLDLYRCFCYFSLGNFGDCKTSDEIKSNMFENCEILLKCGAVNGLIEALHRELSRFPEHIEVASSMLSSPAVANLTIRPEDTLPLRLVMTPLYIMAESIRQEGDVNKIEDFREQLAEPLPHVNEIVVVTLLEMMTRFCNGDAPHYPIKKVTLLLWKLLLASLGNLREAHEVKNKQREAFKLPRIDEFTEDICKRMRACSPPPVDMPVGGAALINQLNSASNGQHQDESNGENGGGAEQKKEHRRPKPPHFWKPKVTRSDLEKFINERRLKFVNFTAPGDVDSLIGLPRPIHEAVRILKLHLYYSLKEFQLKEEDNYAKTPLTYQGIDTGLDGLPAEKLFIAMLPSLPQYCIAILRLMLAAEPPAPNQQNQPNQQNPGAGAAGAVGGQSRTPSGSISVLTDCVQLALTGQSQASVEASISNGVEICRHRETILKSLAAILLLLLKHFKAAHILHFELISQHLVFANAFPLLVRLLSHNLCGLAAASNSLSKFEFPNCVLDKHPVDPVESEDKSAEEGDDDDENKEIEIQQLQQDQEPQFNWRTVHTAVNLLRILNKLVKGKHHRIALLHSLRCAGLLKRTIRLKQSLVQLYALKLLKLQSRFLGRQWRRQNMHIVSAIYERVRHRLTDDWAYGAVDPTNPLGGIKDMESLSGRSSTASSVSTQGGGAGANVGPSCPEFQAAESQLRNMIDKFHSRKYHWYLQQGETGCLFDTGSMSRINGQAPSLLLPASGNKDDPQNSFDNRYCCAENLKCHCSVWSACASVTSDLESVTEDFFSGILLSKMTPEEWIQREIFDNPIDWDRLLVTN